MLNLKRYNIFLFFATFARNLVELYSGILLYKKGFNQREILLFYAIYYFFGIIIDILIYKIIKYIKIKYILLVSLILYIYSYYFLNNMNSSIYNLIVFAILLASANFSYHYIRHYLAIITINNKKDIGSILIFMYIALIPSSYIGAILIEKYSLIMLIIIMTIIFLISIHFLDKITIKEKPEKDIHISKEKIIFFIFQQYKILYLLIFPLYYYININKNTISFGYLTIFISLFAIITTYIYSRCNIKIFKYNNYILFIILILKLYIKTKTLLIIIAIIEGICLKIYEVVITNNLYQTKGNIKKYLLYSEIIFNITLSISCIIFMLINNLKVCLIIMAILVLISSYLIKNTNQEYD